MVVAMRPPQVILVEPTGRDKPAYVKLREESRAWLEPWEPTIEGDGGVAEDRFAEDAFDRFLSSASTPQSRRFLVRLASQRGRGELIGQVSLNNIARGAFQCAALGYWVGHRFAGRGYMTEAVRLAVSRAFGPMRLHRVEANIIPTNEPSRALVRRLGFRLEGLSPRFLRIAGRWQDHERWALTAEEWTERDGR